MLMLFINLSLGLHSSFFRGLFVVVTAPSAFCYLLLYFHSLSPPGGPCHFLFWLAEIQCSDEPFRLPVPAVEDLHLISVTPSSPLDIQYFLSLSHVWCIFLFQAFTSLSGHCSQKCFLDLVPLSYLTFSFPFTPCSFGTRKQNPVLCFPVICDTCFCLLPSSAFFPV